MNSEPLLMSNSTLSARNYPERPPERFTMNPAVPDISWVSSARLLISIGRQITPFRNYVSLCAPIRTRKAPIFNVEPRGLGLL